MHLRLSFAKSNELELFSSAGSHTDLGAGAGVLIWEVLVIITGEGMKEMEVRLLIDQNEQRAAGVIDGIPVGERKVRVELKNSLSQIVYFGETIVDITRDRTTTAVISMRSLYEGMAYLPSAEFIMGSEEGDSDELPVRRVYLDVFWIDAYEVSNSQYVDYLNEALAGDQIEVSDGSVLTNNNVLLYFDDPDCHITYNGEVFNVEGGKGNYPVVCVSWYGAAAYAEHMGKRLPSEAEWERAARSTDGRTYPWGDAIPTTAYCNFADSLGGVTPVAQFTPEGDSPCGCGDMAGNVSEWCADLYDENYYSRAINDNPAGPASGSSRVLRGGSWGSDDSQIRCASRDHAPPESYSEYIGFRCAR